MRQQRFHFRSTNFDQRLKTERSYFQIQHLKVAAVELDKIEKVMNEHPTMVIELGSHADCLCSVQFKETLSANRAKAFAAYFKQRISNLEPNYGNG